LVTMLLASRPLPTPKELMVDEADVVVMADTPGALSGSPVSGALQTAMSGPVRTSVLSACCAQT